MLLELIVKWFDRGTMSSSHQITICSCYSDMSAQRGCLNADSSVHACFCAESVQPQLLSSCYRVVFWALRDYICYYFLFLLWSDLPYVSLGCSTSCLCLISPLLRCSEDWFWWFCGSWRNMNIYIYMNVECVKLHADQNKTQNPCGFKCSGWDGKRIVALALGLF